jgi:putative SOS response-associated peptidase YedK
MSVAGIWETWRKGTSDEQRSLSILTTAANEFMREIHDRMPVILGRGEEDAWLDPENDDIETDWQADRDAQHINTYLIARKNKCREMRSIARNPAHAILSRRLT